ncbi:MAG TPA: polyphosphate polymerase domain-containing protein [Myxococcota bacterium]|nr:polyphosphate polymerase domain-containing protein [Myxococcota bacterium]HRY96505.1 polyphosphate polymerase domain-containing protein [Myxococcota bacterium]
MIRRFNRYELKYLVDVRTAGRIRADLGELASLDAHGGPQGYRLASLYYDSPGLDFYWAKIEGIKFRRKLRLRVYLPGDGTPPRDGLVEIKQRVNRTVRKRRLVLPLEEAERLCAGEQPDRPLDEEDRQVASEVCYLVQAMHLQPTAITSYRRVAYVGGRYDRGLRVTLDYDCRGRDHALEVDLDAQDHPFLPPDVVVLEVKADEVVPDWVTSLLARHNCHLQRLSKYCAALARARGLAYTVATPASAGRDHGR